VSEKKFFGDRVYHRRFLATLPCLLASNFDSSDNTLMQTLLKHVLEMKHDMRYGFRGILLRIVE
jgi:hypothetical protein